MKEHTKREQKSTFGPLASIHKFDIGLTSAIGQTLESFK
jgi:hypothetical protein